MFELHRGLERTGVAVVAIAILSAAGLVALGKSRHEGDSRGGGDEPTPEAGRDRSVQESEIRGATGNHPYVDWWLDSCQPEAEWLSGRRGVENLAARGTSEQCRRCSALAPRAKRWKRIQNVVRPEVSEDWKMWQGYEAWADGPQAIKLARPIGSDTLARQPERCALLERLRPLQPVCTWISLAWVVELADLPELERLCRQQEGRSVPTWVPAVEDPHKMTIMQLCSIFGLALYEADFVELRTFKVGSGKVRPSKMGKGILAVHTKSYGVLVEDGHALCHSLPVSGLRRDEHRYPVEVHERTIDAWEALGFDVGLEAQQLALRIAAEAMQEEPEAEVPAQRADDPPAERATPELDQEPITNPVLDLLQEAFGVQSYPPKRAEDQARPDPALLKSLGETWAVMPTAVADEALGRLLAAEYLQRAELERFGLEWVPRTAKALAEVVKAEAYKPMPPEEPQANRATAEKIAAVDVFVGPNVPPADKAGSYWVGAMEDGLPPGEVVVVAPKYISEGFTGMYHGVMLALGHRSVAYEATRDALIGARVAPGVLVYSEVRTTVGRKDEYARGALSVARIEGLVCQGVTYRLGHHCVMELRDGRRYEVAEVMPSSSMTPIRRVLDRLTPGIQYHRVLKVALKTEDWMHSMMREIMCIPDEHAQFRALSHLVKEHMEEKVVAVFLDLRAQMLARDHPMETSPVELANSLSRISRCLEAMCGGSPAWALA